MGLLLALSLAAPALGQPTENNDNALPLAESSAETLPPADASAEPTQDDQGEWDSIELVTDTIIETWEERVADIDRPEQYHDVRVYVVAQPFVLTYYSPKRDGEAEEERITVTGDRLVVWQGINAASEDEPRLLEIYAAGNVRMEWKTDTFLTDQLFFSLTRARGVMTNVRARRIGSDRGEEYFLAADELRVLSQSEAVVVGARASVTPFALPWLHLRSERVRFLRRRGQRVLEIDSPRFYVRNTQILPIWDQRKNFDNPGLVHRVNVFNSARYGWTGELQLDLGVIWNALVTRDPYARIVGGQNLIGFNYHTARGFAPTLRLGYDTDRYSGGLYGWFLSDSGDPTAAGASRGYVPLEDNIRERLKLWHHHEFPLGMVFNGQLSFFSDRNVEPEFFESEYNRRYNQGTFAELARWDPRIGWRIYYERQLNTFEPTTEYQPRLDFYLFPFQVMRVPWVRLPIYGHLDLDIARPGYQPAAGSNESGTYTTRVNAEPGLTMPIDMGVVGMRQTASAQFTWYGWELDSEDVTWPGVYAFRYTASAYTHIHRTFSFSSDTLELRGLRHIVTPEVTYERTFPVTYVASHGVTESTRPMYDELDAGELEDVIFLRLRNRLQGKRRGLVADVVDMVLETSYYPRPSRDNSGEVWGPWVGSAVLRPTWLIYIRGDIRYEPQIDHVDRWSVMSSLAVTKRFELLLSHRVVTGESVISGARASWQVSPAYLMTVETEYDFSTSEFRSVQMNFRRTFPDFTLSFTFRRDLVLQDTIFIFNFIPASVLGVSSVGVGTGTTGNASTLRSMGN